MGEVGGRFARGGGVMLAMRRTRVSANGLVALRDQERRRHQPGSEGYDASVVPHFQCASRNLAASPRGHNRPPVSYRMLPIRFLS